MVMDREKLTAGALPRVLAWPKPPFPILGPRNKYPSTEVILRLHQRYNDINLEWLLTGKGNMSNNPDSPENDGFDYPLFAENPKKSDQRPDETEKSQGNCIRNISKSA